MPIQNLPDSLFNRQKFVNRNSGLHTRNTACYFILCINDSYIAAWSFATLLIPDWKTSVRFHNINTFVAHENLIPFKIDPSMDIYLQLFLHDHRQSIIFA